MTLPTPPLYDVLTDENGKANINWSVFFQNTANGDVGESWTPTFQNLTEVGTPTMTGQVYRLTKYITLFRATVTPATSTTATAGTTYIDNFPLNFTADGVCWAVSGNLGDGPGHIVATSNRIYVPSWSAVTVPLTIIGISEAS